MPTLTERLAAASGGIFYSALPEVDALTTTQFSAIVPDLAVLLSRSEHLSERDKADRINAVLSRRPQADLNFLLLLERARDFSPGVRNALARFLRPEQRHRLASRSPVSEALPRDHKPDAANAEARDLEPDVAPDVPLTVNGSINDNDPGSSISLYSTVLVLSTGPNQEGVSWLISHYRPESDSRFYPLHFDTWVRARSDLLQNADVCGCVIDGSFIASMDAEQQADFFRELGLYSSFLWIRVDESELKLPNASVREILRTARCQLAPVRADGISFSPNGILRESELPDLERARALLWTYRTTRLSPGGLQAEEGNLLRAAVRQREEENHFDRNIDLSTLEVEFLSGGRSGARTLLVRVNGDLPGMIAKLNERHLITDEIHRFYTFIQPWDRELQPRAFFHRDSAVILFGLLPDQTNPLRPAEMLEQQLQELWNEEVFCPDEQTRQRLELRAHNFGDSLEAVAQKLLDLNRRRPTTDRYPGHGVPDPVYFDGIEGRGIQWGLEDQTRDARLVAKSVFDRLQGRATVHGDLHLRNILLRAERDPHLIDYASSGPGHPAIDLVRFELALFAGISKQLDSEAKYVRLQSAFSVDKAPLAELKRDFPGLFSCMLNEVCLRGCVASRDRALEAIRIHEGDDRDYLATKYLVAWQSLTLQGRQASLARSIIKALAPVISQWVT